jgi:tetratricopeptide (TPR) repeat protein
MPRPLVPLLIAVTLFLSCPTPGLAAQPNEREWTLLSADYEWINTLRKAQAVPLPPASRKQQIEALLENHRKIEPVYVNFMDKLRDYYERTSDPRAAAVLAHEKIAMGDEYMNVLSRYDRAIELYTAALQYDPASAEAKQRIEVAQARRWIAMGRFAGIKNGMKEDEVRKWVGLPREDWIKQVVQNNRIYSVWIYPKEDGGAAAIYFDNGAVYHTNWNAASPPAPPAAPVPAQ